MNKKLVISSVIIAVVIGIYFGATFFIESKATEEIDKMVKVSGADIKYENVSVNLIGSKLTINNIKFEDHSVSKLVLNDIYSYDYNKKSIPKHLNVQFKGFSLNTDKLRNEIKRDINALGYKGIVNMDFGVNYSYHKDKSAFSLESISFDVKDMYKIDFRADFENIKLDFDNPGSFMQILFKYPDYKLAFSEVLYNDDSFMKRTLESIAKNSNTTYEMHKEKIEKMIAFQIDREKDQSVKDFYSGAGKIMFEPGSYTIRISPEKPVAIKDIMGMRDPATAIKTLNLTIQ